MREAPSHVHDAGFVGIPHGQQRVPGSRQADPRSELSLQIGRGEVLIDAHRLAGRFHLGAEDHVAAREARERQHRLFDRDVLKSGLGEPEAGQRLAGHDPGRDLCHGHRRRLCHEGHCTAGPRIDLEHIDIVALDGILHVHQADDAEPAGQQPGSAGAARPLPRTEGRRAAARRRSHPNAPPPPRSVASRRRCRRPCRLRSRRRRPRQQRPGIYR